MDDTIESIHRIGDDPPLVGTNFPRTTTTFIINHNNADSTHNVRYVTGHAITSIPVSVFRKRQTGMPSSSSGSKTRQGHASNQDSDERRSGAAVTRNVTIDDSLSADMLLYSNIQESHEKRNPIHDRPAEDGDETCARVEPDALCERQRAVKHSKGRGAGAESHSTKDKNVETHGDVT